MLLSKALSLSSIGPAGRGMLVSRAAMTDPSRRLFERGTRSTYCSPTADMLCTSAGIFGEVSIASVAFAARSRAGRGHAANLHTTVGDVAEPVEPTGIRAIQDDGEMPFRLDKLS